ncbi:MAG: PASTA domain-containing protein, partial [Acidimicrobiia bacterium]|nr:PASTA domain-containing protein [Acidimicrobiia bacterium]
KGSFVTLVESAGIEQFTVPQVIGETEEVARALIKAQGFQVGLIEYTLSEDVAEQTVTSQNPSGGTPAASGTLVDLVVSKGPFSLEVPDTSGMSAENAQLKLTETGFTNVVTDEEFSSDIAAGFTIRTEPEAGRVVGRDDTITVWVSTGPEPTSVPNLVGKTISVATTTAENAGLVLTNDGTVDVTAVSGLAGLVAEQSPRTGETVDSGTEVRVKVGVLRQVTVPNFLNDTQSQAETKASNAGLIAVFLGEIEVGDPALVGKVVDQDPTTGTAVDDGSDVGLFLGKAPPTTTTSSTTTPPTTATTPTTAAP